MESMQYQSTWIVNDFFVGIIKGYTCKLCMHLFGKLEC